MSSARWLVPLGLAAVGTALPGLARHAWARRDEALCVAAAATAIVLVTARVLLRRRRRRPATAAATAGPATRRGSLALAAGLALAYALLAQSLPPIVGFALACLVPAAVLSALLWGRSLQLGLAGLTLLALPQLDGLRALLGYPLRIAVGLASVPLLALQGFSVELEGTGIAYGDRTIWIDAPCSGIGMLSMGGLATFGLILAYDLSAARALVVGALAGLLLFGANVMRTVSLFHLEIGGVTAGGDEVHTAVGLASFALATLALLVGAHRVARPSADAVAGSRVGAPRHVRLFALCATAAAVLGFALPASPDPATPVAHQRFPGWPGELRGRRLEPMPLSEGEALFAEGFPGRMARFRAGADQVILRWVTHLTRDLHPADVCHRAAGYVVRERAIEHDADGSAWAVFVAEKDDARQRVRERIRDEQGHQWTDLSAWLWQAGAGSLEGPWWSEIWIEPERATGARASPRVR